MQQWNQNKVLVVASIYHLRAVQMFPCFHLERLSFQLGCLGTKGIGGSRDWIPVELYPRFVRTKNCFMGISYLEVFFHLLFWCLSQKYRGRKQPPSCYLNQLDRTQCHQSIENGANVPFQAATYELGSSNCPKANMLVKATTNVCGFLFRATLQQTIWWSRPRLETTCWTHVNICNISQHYNAQC